MTETNWFTTDRLVILTSKLPIDCIQWSDYISDNWTRLMHKGSRFLVLTGCHGGSDGTIGRKDKFLFDMWEDQVELRLKRDFKKDIEEKNITITVEDIGKHMDDSSKLIDDTLIEAIKKHQPTVISLAFCYTNVSHLNNILRAAGIYSILVMSKDRADITEGGYVSLDPAQRKIVERVANENPNNLILFGSSGTGKTLLLTEALSMKVSYYKSKGIKIKIIVSAWFRSAHNMQLMKDLEFKYLHHLTDEDNIKFIVFKDLCYGKY